MNSWCWCKSDEERVNSRRYCTAHVGWDVAGYGGLFCSSNKPCDRWYEFVLGVKSSGRGAFIAEIVHFCMWKIGVLSTFYSQSSKISFFSPRLRSLESNPTGLSHASLYSGYAKLPYLVPGYRLPASCTQTKTRCQAVFIRKKQVTQVQCHRGRSQTTWAVQ